MNTSSTPLKTDSKRPKPPERQIADILWEELKPKGIKFLYPAVARRIADFLREVEDRDQVELVCLTIAASDLEEFNAGHSLSWFRYEYVRDMLGVPDGLWRYALWLRQEDDERLAGSIEYWLNYARDGDWDERREAEAMLEKLWTRKVMEAISWT